MAISVRDCQLNVLLRMLNLNLPLKDAVIREPVWKILICDSLGHDIISTLMPLKDLRESGVTLHLSLHSDRDSIPDVPIIYFVLPIKENIQQIIKDFNLGLYDVYYFNFISPIPREQLEDLAAAALHSNCVSQIQKVFDQYMNFIGFEDDLFILRPSNDLSYYDINRGNIKDNEIEAIIDQIVDGLFSVLVTLGAVPIIRCPKGNAAEMVAKKLDRKLRENLRDIRSSLFAGDDIQTGHFSFQRPLLIILDRIIDLATPLHHTWTYQTLAHDVLDLKLNKIFIKKCENKKLESYEFSAKDKFWMAHKGSPFPTVAEAVQEELDHYRVSEDEIKKLKCAMGLDGQSDETISLLVDNTAILTSAVNSLPELLEKKRLIDLHTSVATAILDFIKIRKLDIFFEIEEKIMSRTSADNKSLLELLSQDESGTCEDKMRLFLIAYICTPNMSDVEVEQYIQLLRKSNCDLNPFFYLKQWKKYNNPSQYSGGGTKTVNMFSKLMSHGSSFVMEGVKNLVIKKHNLPITRIVDALMEHKSIPEVEDYHYFDPKILHTADLTNVARNKTFQEALVFVVGSGNYIEYQNLLEYSKSRTNKKIIYGSTCLQNGNQFLLELSKLGSEINIQ